MFDLLKKKIGSFTEKVKKRIEKKAAVSEELAEEKAAKEIEQPLEARAAEKSVEEPAIEAEERPVEEEKIEEPAAEEEERPAEEEKVEEPAVEEEKGPVEEGLPVEEKVKEPILAEEEKAPVEEEKIKAVEEEKRELKPKVSVKGRLKAAITGAVELKDSDLKDLLSELELALLEADVEQTTAEEICREMRKKLAGKKIARGKSVEAFVKKEIAGILLGMMHTEQFDLLKKVRAKKDKPFKILFLGPNGAGKTTSIAKLTWLLQSKGMKVIWAASDTFRAASIEQLEKHAKKLNVRVIKHQYGADPAAVAFDAVKAAQGKRIDVVLIDSAGRQETNSNLMGELQKIVRVVQPDLRLYVGEAFTGQSLLQQAKEYDKIVGVDAFILTKIDCDAKGGTTISLLYKLGKPILFVGVGQEYKDLKKFEPLFVLDKVIG